jgi:DNA-binding NarL/FixJ family response regulator
MKPVRVLLVDDHKVVRQGLRSVLEIRGPTSGARRPRGPASPTAGFPRRRVRPADDFLVVDENGELPVAPPTMLGSTCRSRRNDAATRAA